MINLVKALTYEADQGHKLCLPRHFEREFWPIRKHITVEVAGEVEDFHILSRASALEMIDCREDH